MDNTTIIGNLLGAATFHTSYSQMYQIDPSCNGTIKLDNYNTVDHGVNSSETIGSNTLSTSYTYTSKPSWFGPLSWPPFDPTNFAAASAQSIPAGYRYYTGVDPGNTPVPSPTPVSPTPTPTPTPSPGVTPTPGGGPAMVQSNGIDSPAGLSHVITLPSVTNHSVLICSIRVGTGPVVTNVSDTSSNSWTQVGSVQVDSQGNSLFVYKVINAAASGPLTVTVSLTGLATGRLTILEASGCSNVTPIDQMAQANGDSTGPDSGSTGTTSQPNDLLLGIVETDGGFNSISPGPGWTQQQAIATSKLFLETQSVATTGTYNATASLGGTDSWAAFCVALRGATPPSPPQGLHVVP
jgi:hypothetical protein